MFTAYIYISHHLSYLLLVAVLRGCAALRLAGFVAAVLPSPPILNHQGQTALGGERIERERANTHAEREREIEREGRGGSRVHTRGSVPDRLQSVAVRLRRPSWQPVEPASRCVACPVKWRVSVQQVKSSRQRVHRSRSVGKQPWRPQDGCLRRG